MRDVSHVQCELRKCMGNKGSGGVVPGGSSSLSPVVEWQALAEKLEQVSPMFYHCKYSGVYSLLLCFHAIADMWCTCFFQIYHGYKVYYFSATPLPVPFLCPSFCELQHCHVNATHMGQLAHFVTPEFVTWLSYTCCELAQAYNWTVFASSVQQASGLTDHLTSTVGFVDLTPAHY